MTEEEAVELLSKEGISVVGTKLHPSDWGLFEWAKIVALAIRKNPALMKDIEVYMKDPAQNWFKPSGKDIN